MSVKQAQREIDSAEFSEWIAFNDIEPFGEERDDLRSAIVAATIANIFRGKGPAHKVADFMPKFHKERSEAQSPEYIWAVLSTLAQIHGDDSKP